jgi:hypothetical protein
MKTATEKDLYLAMQDSLAEAPGYRLLTVLRFTSDGEGLERLFSSNAQVYPARGVKQIGNDRWLRHLLTITEPRLSPDAEAVRRNFFDSQAIFDLGCESALNVPILFQGRNLGTLNLLHRGHWYQPSDGGLCMPFANQIGAAWAASVNQREFQ